MCIRRQGLLTYCCSAAGSILGIILILTWALSIGAIVQKNHITVGLVAMNWLLIVDMLGILIIGTFVWVFTLQERIFYHQRFIEAPQSLQIAIQNKVCYRHVVISEWS